MSITLKVLVAVKVRTAFYEVGYDAGYFGKQVLAFSISVQ
jgi:hypothetical protein